MPRVCDCGCGQSLAGHRANKLYANDRHRKRAHRARTRWHLTGPFWAGYRQLRRPARPPVTT